MKGKIGYIWGPILKPSICFQCSWNFQGIFIDNWSQDCQIYKKMYREVFWKNVKFVGMDQIMCKTVTKGAWATWYYAQNNAGIMCITLMWCRY